MGFFESKKERTRRVLRAINPYPVVFVPNQFGGWDAFFPNFPKAVAAGVNFNLARRAAREELTTRFYLAFRDGRVPPPPSDPREIPGDDEEIAGTRIEMIEPDRDDVLRRLGLHQPRMRTSPSGQKYKP